MNRIHARERFNEAQTASALLTWEKVGRSMSLSCLALLEDKTTVDLPEREDALGNHVRSAGNSQFAES